MKGHILAALREEFQRWEDVLAGMREEAISAPRQPSDWSTKDEIAHLWAWQQRSIARVEAARDGHEPRYPAWPEALDAEAEDSTNAINDWIYTSNREQPWAVVYERWRTGFQQFIDAAEPIAERDLLDSSHYPWLSGYSLAAVLIASYDHHQEHLEALLARLRREG